MMYTMKAGELYLNGKAVARIKGNLAGPEKLIQSPDGGLLLQTGIRTLEAPEERRGDVRFRRYVLLDKAGRELATAGPGYADGEEPEPGEWPVCRLPKVDHADVRMDGVDYRLTMRSSQCYVLEKAPGAIVLQVRHKGLTGGWDIETGGDLSPEQICAIFVFCRYTEQENEFLIV